MSHDNGTMRDLSARYGLHALTEEQRARLFELAAQTAIAAQAFPRITDKQVAPCYPGELIASASRTTQKRNDDVP